MKDQRFINYLKKLNNHKGFHYEGNKPMVELFEENYIKVREKEGRLYSKTEIKSLPYLMDHPLSKEWKLRQAGTKRVNHYFQKEKDKVLIDIGCGNGWFSHLLAKNPGLSVIGLDINTLELEQAATIFSRDNLDFLYGDIFKLSIPLESVDLFTMNASIQYFPEVDKLFGQLMDLLKQNGQIHIIDSPFYSFSDVNAAKQRTGEYYTNLGFPGMANFYYHHTWDRLADWDYDVLYNPSKFSRFKKILNKFDSPFPWLRIRKI